MNDREEIIRRGKEVVRIEGEAVAALGARIDGSFADAVTILFECQGRVVVTGVGKSGNIARKIVGTLNSTGTPAMFLHPNDAMHGDLGMIRREDVVVCISKSGDTPELATLLPMFRRLGLPIISLVGKKTSMLAGESTVVLDASVQEEACPHDLAPTSSTTVTLVLGDALAMALLDKRRFSREDFALHHPGGVLGRRLLLQVDELMVKGSGVPRVTVDVPVRDAIMEMTIKRLGCTSVVNGNGELEGIITDGDLRRLLQHTNDISGTTAGEAMTRNPKTIRKGTLAVVALQEMESYNITQIVVLDEKDQVAGIVHLHDLVKAGLGGEEAS